MVWAFRTISDALKFCEGQELSAVLDPFKCLIVMHGVQLFRMLKDTPDKLTTVNGESFLEDLVNLSRNAIIA